MARASSSSFGTLPGGESAGSVDEQRRSGITDNDTRGVTVSESTLTIDEGGSKSYTVVLDTQPSADVTVTVGGEAGDVTADPTTLTFNTVNWSTAKTVTVSAAVDDRRGGRRGGDADPHGERRGLRVGERRQRDRDHHRESRSRQLWRSATRRRRRPTARSDFEVTLSTASSNQVTVTYATSDGTATAGSDYTSHERHPDLPGGVQRQPDHLGAGDGRQCR